MNLGDLQSARSKERQRDSLQHLSEDFYTDVGAYVAELRTERERAAKAADDPFDAPDVRRLTDDIKTAENTVEAVYERRVGKLVKLASLAAAGMPADREGLTTEESDLFETLVGAIESNRGHVLDDVLAGSRATHDETDAVTASDDGDTDAASAVDGRPPDAAESAGAVDATDGTTERVSRTEADDGVSAADAMGNAPTTADAVAPGGSRTGDSPAESSDSPPTEADRAPAGAEDRAPAGADDAGGETPESDTDRTTVRITRDVGEILGIDERTYHLAAEDVVTLPEVNATPLLERDAAERLGDRKLP